MGAGTRSGGSLDKGVFAARTQCRQYTCKPIAHWDSRDRAWFKKWNVKARCGGGSVLMNKGRGPRCKFYCNRGYTMLTPSARGKAPFARRKLLWRDTQVIGCNKYNRVYEHNTGVRPFTPKRTRKCRGPWQRFYWGQRTVLRCPTEAEVIETPRWYRWSKHNDPRCVSGCAARDPQHFDGPS